MTVRLRRWLSWLLLVPAVVVAAVCWVVVPPLELLGRGGRRVLVGAAGWAEGVCLRVQLEAGRAGRCRAELFAVSDGGAGLQRFVASPLPPRLTPSSVAVPLPPSVSVSAAVVSRSASSS